MTPETTLRKAIEGWKPIPGLEGRYEASRSGMIRNTRRQNVLKPHTDHKGYKRVSIYSGDGRSRYTQVSRLVASAWLPNPNGLPQVNHINGNPKDNYISNLEWCTAQHNVQDGWKRGRQPWNKGRISKSQIYRLCKKYPKQLFHTLSRDDFRYAKAFWGHRQVCAYDGEEWIAAPTREMPRVHYPLESWKYHLQQLALTEDRLAYLQKFL